ncbi:hypothetical protein JYU17_00615, partial [Flavobacteriaceae bacterium AH-315-O20]|nr:hypothetical protein [Flavobacteriaceae bacterium AH-315-O20]
MKNKLLYKYKDSNFLRISFLLCFLAFVSSSFSQSKNLNIAHDKVYIHFDKPNYYAGEDIWFKTYLVNALTHRTETTSKIVYVELINPKNEIIDTKTIKINESDGASDFKLSTDLVSGEYTVRAYTNFMRNFDHSYFFR